MLAEVNRYAGCFLFMELWGKQDGAHADLCVLVAVQDFPKVGAEVVDAMIHDSCFSLDSRTKHRPRLSTLKRQIEECSVCLVVLSVFLCLFCSSRNAL